MFLDNPQQAFQEDDIDQLLSYKEGQYFERKLKRDPKDIAKTLVAFANANINGGLFLVGVDNVGVVKGLHSSYGENYPNEIPRCNESVSHVIPSYRFLKVKNDKGEADEVGLIYVPFSNQQVATTSDGDVYMRIGDKTKKLSHEEIFILRQERGQDIPFGNLPTNVLVKSAQLHTGVLNDYLERQSIQSPGVDLERILLNRHLAVEHQDGARLTKSGLLLLAQDPRYEIPGAYVRVVKYEGRTILYGAQQNVVQDETFHGPIPIVAQRVRDYIRTQMRQFRYLGADNKFITVPELPEDAWFEAIVNALVHRTYQMVNDNVLIRLFEDRFEINSPGSYPFGVDPDEFPDADVTRPRNVPIMEFMREIQYVQMFHEGTKRIFGAMEAAGLPSPVFSPAGGSHVKVTLHNDIDRRRTAQASSENQPPIANIFRLETKRVGFSQPISDDNPPDFQELRNSIEQSIAGNGWAVSSFTNNVAIDFRKPVLLERNNLISFYDAFKFTVQQFNEKFYLTLDYKVEVRNRATLSQISMATPQILSQSFGKGFVRVEGKWNPCYILKVNSAEQSAHVELATKGNRNDRPKLVAALHDILPDLNSTQISDFLRSSGVNLDIYKERIRLSQLSPTERLAKIRDINTDLQRRVFPIKIRGYEIHLDSEPVSLVPPAFYFNRRLREPAISFSEGKLSRDVMSGLTNLGAFEKPRLDIPVILMSTADKMPLMEQLVARLQRGSKKFRGFNFTFGSNLQIQGKFAVNSFSEYLPTCQKITPDLPKSSLPLMLIYMPDEIGLWSRGNYNSPYYQVKHYLLENGIPSQGVDQDTLSNPDFKDLNLALDIFAKTGHTPWVLDEGLPLADIFIGLSYSSIRIDSRVERVIAYVCVFDKFGRWQYYAGNTEPVPFEERDFRLANLIKEAVRQYSKGALVKHIHIHHGHKLKSDTTQKIADSVQEVAPNSNVSFLYINDDTSVRLFSTQGDSEKRIDRGTFVRVGNTRKFFLATTGKTDLQSLYKSTPIVMEAKLEYFGSNRPSDMTVYAQHILSLTRLNWASTRSFSSQPITLLYSNKVARYMNIFMQGFGSFALHPDLERTPWFL